MNQNKFDAKKIYLIETSQKLTASGAKTLDWIHLPKVNKLVTKDNGKMELVHTENKLFMLVMISSSKISALKKALSAPKEIKDVTAEIEEEDYQTKHIQEFDVEAFHQVYESYYLNTVPPDFILEKIKAKVKR